MQSQQAKRITSLAIIEYIKQAIISGADYSDMLPIIKERWKVCNRTAARHVNRFKLTLQTVDNQKNTETVKTILDLRYTKQLKDLEECKSLAISVTEKAKIIEQQRKVCDSLAQLYGIGNSRTSSITNNTIAFLLPDNNTQELFNDKKNSFIEVKAEETPPQGC